MMWADMSLDPNARRASYWSDQMADKPKPDEKTSPTKLTETTKTGEIELKEEALKKVSGDMKVVDKSS
jgi:hypothetical protein